MRHQDEAASKLVLWELMHGYVNTGRKPIDLSKCDTGFSNTSELRAVMCDRDVWTESVTSKLLDREVDQSKVKEALNEVRSIVSEQDN